MATNSQIKKLEQAMREVQRAAKTTIPREVTKIAADHFVENFRRGGFVNGGLQRWKEVKRRDPSSAWYGFEYRGDKRTHYRFTRDRKTGKTYKSKTQKRLNFSPTATKRNILTSKRNYLMNSIKGKVEGERVTISSAAPHAKIHNEGGTFKVFGKATATMPKRQFIGESKELTRAIEAHITKTVDNIFKQFK